MTSMNQSAPKESGLILTAAESDLGQVVAVARTTKPTDKVAASPHHQQTMLHNLGIVDRSEHQIGAIGDIYDSITGNVVNFEVVLSQDRKKVYLDDYQLSLDQVETLQLLLDDAMFRATPPGSPPAHPKVRNIPPSNHNQELGAVLGNMLEGQLQMAALDALGVPIADHDNLNKVLDEFPDALNRANQAAANHISFATEQVLQVFQQWLLGGGPTPGVASEPPAPVADTDLGDNPRTWRIDIGCARATVDGESISELLRIGVTNHGIDLGAYTFTLEETIDVIADLADAVQEFLGHGKSPKLTTAGGDDAKR